MSDMIKEAAEKVVESTKELKKRLIKIFNKETGEVENKEVLVVSDADAEAIEGFSGFVEEETSVLVQELPPVDFA